MADLNVIKNKKSEQECLLKMCIYSLLYPTVNCSVWLPLKRDYASEWCELLLILCYMKQAFIQHQFATVAEARRVSVNYVIAGVNSKNSVQISCKLLADV